jgi:hypothetical protein
MYFNQMRNQSGQIFPNNHPGYGYPIQSNN